MIILEKDRLIIEIKDDSPEQVLYDYRQALMFTTRTILACKDNFLCEESVDHYPTLLSMLIELEFQEIQFRELKQLIDDSKKKS